MTRRLALLFEYPTILGGEASCLASLPAVVQAGYCVTALVPGAGPLRQALIRIGAEVVEFPTHDREGRRIDQSDLRARLDRFLTTRRFDLLHANSMAMGRLAGPVAANRALASLAHLRDIAGLSARARHDLALHTALAAVSHATRQHHVAAGLPAEKIRVLYGGVDTDLFQHRPCTRQLHRELKLPPDAPLVGSIGQIALRKGLDVLLVAARLLAEKRDDVHFVIAGARYSRKDESRQLEQRLIEAAGDGSLSGRFHLLGHRDDVSDWIGELTVVAHAARQEPLGRVLLEAAAAERAIVATRVGGTEEIFPADQHAAALVPADDAAVLAFEIEQLLDRPSARAVMGRTARKRVVEQFDLAAASQRLIDSYRRLAG